MQKDKQKTCILPVAIEYVDKNRKVSEKKHKKQKERKKFSALRNYIFLKER